MQRRPWIVGALAGIAAGGLTSIRYGSSDSLAVGMFLGVTAGAFTWFMLRFRARTKDRHSKRAKPVTFTSLDAQPAKSRDPLSLEGLVDALTLEPLDRRLGIYQCEHCEVCYYESSVRFLRAQNHGMCVSCGKTSIKPMEGLPLARRGRNCAPEVVTLTDYRRYVGRVVTFEGLVIRVDRDRRQKNYSVLFRGLTAAEAPVQVFVLEPNVNDVGGKRFIEGLPGKTIRVRGLLRDYGGFLYAVFLTKRSAILEIR